MRAAVHQYLLHCWLIQDRAGIISIFDEVAGHPEYRVAEMAMAPPTRNGAVLARQEFVDLTAQIIAIRRIRWLSSRMLLSSMSLLSEK